ncbi:DeoR/GlpR family DNA-binding transcription regulator [Paracoccus mangrovi]|jgi:DeoR/GlpR family transcriptional regulator of sugar metabolism|uniref:DeoR/GlpR family DNA-binding transcription regulator n=1 Tax=Paracoccus mangrovi TaxID=1715645 RepID=A0ABV7R4M0_9RHOB
MPRTLGEKSEVIPAKRRAMVLELVRRSGVASVQDLAAAIQASPSTVRRDLEILTHEGMLSRTHGGAVALTEPSSTFELEPRLNARIRAPEKRIIGIEAAKRIRSGESVIFDSSSTVFAAAEAALSLDIEITAVTNSLEIGSICATAENWRLYVLGGMLRPGSPLLTGEPAEHMLATMHADLCLMGVYAITGDIMTDPIPEVASIKRHMIRAARRTILLADGSKFRQPAFAEFCRIPQIAEVITDSSAPEKAVEELRSSGVKVTLAQP